MRTQPDTNMSSISHTKREADKKGRQFMWLCETYAHQCPSVRQQSLFDRALSNTNSNPTLKFRQVTEKRNFFLIVFYLHFAKFRCQTSKVNFTLARLKSD